MIRAEFDMVMQKIEEGRDYPSIDRMLAPYIEKGDLDARYLKTQYHSGGSFDGEDFDRWRASELVSLSKEGHPESLFQLGLLHMDGDLVEHSVDRARVMISMAALLGCEEAKRSIERSFGHLW